MSVTVVLLSGDESYSGILETGQEITFGSHKKDKIKVPEFAANQVLIKSKGSRISVHVKKPYSLDNNDFPINSLMLLDKEKRIKLYISSLAVESEKKIKLPYNCKLKFGSALSNNDVVISQPFVSRYHFVLTGESGNVRVEDLKSTNGIYVNGHKVKGAIKLKSGDILSIWSVQIKLLNGELLFYNVGDSLIIRNDGNVIKNETSHIQEDGSYLKYRRSPREQNKLPVEDIILAAAPSKGQKYVKGRGMLSHLLGSGGMLVASMFSVTASPAMLAARSAGLIPSVVSIASSGRTSKDRKKNAAQYEALRWEKYGAYIDAQKALIENVAKEQRDILTDENPSPQDCIGIVCDLRRNLWERSFTERDFLDVRIGMGYDPLCVAVKSRTDTNNVQMEDDEIRELSEQLIEATRIVDVVPARIKLLKNNTVGVIGDRRKTIGLIRNFITSLTTLHCFEDVKIIGIFDEDEKKIWESLRWIPHVWSDSKQFRFLAFDKESTHNLCGLFNDVLKERRGEIKETYQVACVPRPHYVFILGSKDLIEKEEILSNLLVNNPAMGTTSLFLFDDIYLLPHECKYIIDMDNGPCAYDRNAANKKTYFSPDPYIDESQFDLFARRMSAVKLVGGAKDVGMPSGITFLQGYGVETVEQLNIMEFWQSALPYQSLAAPIGAMNGEKTFKLDIHEKSHGPHGLVAGTTGSGKSELLQTWILSMCIQFHPYDVSFVIIDYKGGGMANLLEPLPHVVGKITNIGSNIGRSLISLQSEIKRRLTIFDQYGVNHIDKYQKLYKAGTAEEPLPHLVIVADEFAELKKEEPEFMAGLVSASRVGRSLGVHLVLATQKPGGVVDDQIQSNSRFRLCLKVQDANDSREMIKRPDAARITQAGRSYIRVGEDEYFDLFQSYWSGAPYFGSVKHDDNIGNQVRIVDSSGRRIKTVADNKARFKTDLDELTAIVRYICATAKDNGIKPLPGPWLPDLPETISLQDLSVEGGFDGEKWTGKPKWLTVPIGKYDSPKTQSQGTQYLDFATDGHYGIYGAPGTGKTSLLKEVVLAIGTYYTPEDAIVYILDCGGWGMSVFSCMPHVGGVALDSEEEKFSKFEKLILEELENRKKAFLSNSVGSLAAYRETASPKLPAIVVVIDNIVPLFDLYPDMENFFVMLAREGATYGIYMLFTSNSLSGVRYKVAQNIKGAIAFELTDKGDYASLVGRLEGMALSKTVGRAFFKNSPPIEFQAALFADGKSDQEKTLKLQAILEKMNSAWTGDRPKPIPVMPETISFNQMLSEYTLRTSIPVGIDSRDIQTAHVDLSDKYSMLVCGPMHSGKSKMLEYISRLISAKFYETKIFVFDSQSTSLSSLSSSAYKYTVSTDDEAVSDLLAELVECLNTRKRAQNQARQEAGESFSEKEFIVSYETLCIIIDDLKEFVDVISNESRDSMERICRLAQNLGVMVVAAGRLADVLKYNEIESLTRVIVGNQNGLAVAGTPAQISFFQNDLKYTEKDIEPGEGNGYLFINGKCAKVKLVQ